MSHAEQWARLKRENPALAEFTVWAQRQAMIGMASTFVLGVIFGLLIARVIANA